MHCPDCEYPLWNLTSRVCPECGRAFRPSEFELLPNTVQFCCPGCMQVYYGTGANGHLVPPEFDCVTCGRHLHMDDMIVRPLSGPDVQAQPERVPWLDPGKGWVPRWLATIGWALVRPVTLMRAAPLRSLWPSVGFMAITACVVQILALTPILLFPLMIGIMAAGGAAGRGGAAVGAMSAGLGFFSLATLLAQGVFLLAWGLAAHALLRLTGKTRAGASRTFQALCFSSGANIASATPCVGLYFGWIWWLVSAVLMVREGQRVSGARASLAVLTLPVLALIGAVGGYTWLLVSVLPLAASSAAPGALNRTQSVTHGIIQHATMGTGRGPSHAIQLVESGAVGSWTLKDWATATTQPAVARVPTTRVGREQLLNFETLPLERKRAAILDAINALPPNPVAHRLGDFVFTYHGINLNNADARLWLVVYVGDDAAPPAEYAVGLADNTVTTVAAGSFDAALAEQNALRESLGLPPLPDLRRITTTQPAGSR
ncbi:MAG: hypothetical protein LC135_00800 [Phycisphaerae bacterium]|nr:hypothetical protein [Phycisphaerae bacterium]MCZ2398389.1 hypothetical protein [Phycisphaerae bacterium]NUQ49150.1 hypothetical protein [Phycisphaerae bacterium]